MHGLELVELGHPAALLQVGYSRQEPSSPPLPREQLWEVLDPRPEGETLEIVLSIRKHPYSFIKFSIFFWVPVISQALFGYWGAAVNTADALPCWGRQTINK